MSELKRRLTQLELREEDDVRELETERALLAAESDAHQRAIEEVRFGIRQRLALVS